MSKTKGEAITEKLDKLKTDLAQYIDISLFDTEMYELSDIVYLLSVTFHSLQTEDEYKAKIRELILMQDPKFNRFDDVFPLLIEFILFFKSI